MSMTGIKKGMAVGVLSLGLLVGAGGPSALAHGNSHEAPGQEKAIEKCNANVDKQNERGLQAGGGPKAQYTGPTNCDHFWQIIGAIGN